MRNINCRNVRREIEETATGDVLSSPANDHVTNCVACETLSREHAKLQQIVSSLGTVEAPGDFDFRLRARLVGEKPGSARSFAPFGIGGFSFGLRSAAVAVMLMLVAAAFVLVSFRAKSDNPLSASESRTAPTEIVKTDASGVTSTPIRERPKVAVAGVKSANLSASPGNRQGGSRQTGLASLGQNNRVVALDLASTQARVLKRDQLVEGFPTTAFPIDASYQSLKVSVDNGRGSSRTISLPTVSFGSKQSLSQSSPPLVAAAREAW
jgi:hypothetical protein